MTNKEREDVKELERLIVLSWDHIVSSSYSRPLVMGNILQAKELLATLLAAPARKSPTKGPQ